MLFVIAAGLVSLAANFANGLFAPSSKVATPPCSRGMVVG